MDLRCADLSFANAPFAENMRVSQTGGLLIRLAPWLAVIACGLGLRAYGLGWGLPAPFAKYGGSVLWGSMVFLLLTLAGHASPARRQLRSRR
jgi:hypothetical protein